MRLLHSFRPYLNIYYCFFFFHRKKTETIPSLHHPVGCQSLFFFVFIKLPFINNCYHWNMVNSVVKVFAPGSQADMGNR